MQKFLSAGGKAPATGGPAPDPQTGVPRADRGPGASSNMTDFRFCKRQNRRRKCRSFVQIMM